MALPSKQRGSEECDLGALLNRLTDLVPQITVLFSHDMEILIRNEEFVSLIFTD